ncbi:MAG: hypothetical protein H0W86_08560, partial [Armatimonadetes bacterium]|nr:hypothetical protein [Armatimonadota bacterium]
MNKTTFAPVLLLLPAVLQAQTFTQVAPLPTSADLWGVDFVSPSIGFIAGEGHTLFKTTDGGDNWTSVALPGYQDGPFYNVTFATPSLGFVSGNSAIGSKDIFRTVDGGATWAQVQSFPLGGSWYHQDYIDGTTGFMGSNGGLVRTQDAGETWLLRSGYPDCPVISGMDFIDANTGLVSGLIAGSSDEGIFKTTNGGQTWRLKHPRAANDVVYLSDLIAVADSGVGVVRTHDGGETWFQTGATIETGLGDIEVLGSNTLVGVSLGGDIWRSDDGGYSWNLRWIGEGDLPASWSVSFQDSLNGHVVGPSGAILASADGGLNWTRVNRGIS